uniref:Peptidase S1 domain-containing protein n=1 Tax=Ciona savignyi TaxID=51511 RepID=H2YC29_CIOSA
MRTRRCLSGLCRGRNIDVVSCNYQPCSYWSQWSSYTCCSVTCGGNGVKERRRSCRYGRYLGNRGCVGEYRQQTECSSHPCNTTFPSVFSTFECGMRNRRPVNKLSNTVLRIFGGQISEEHGWPWQASWQHKDCNLCSWGHLCGATLVAPRWVVTA